MKRPPPAPGLPDRFLRTFVRRSLRERFAHEWGRRPGTAHGRICHGISDLFEDRWQSSAAPFAPDEPCLLLGGGAARTATFAEAAADLGAGSGVLIVSLDGGRFVAESEATQGCPSVRYAGEDRRAAPAD